MSNNRRPNSREYASRVIKKSVGKSLLSESNSVSSCPSSSSDSDNSDFDSSSPRLRLKYTLNSSDSYAVYASSTILIPHGKSKDKDVIVIPNFVSPKKISKLISLFESSPSVYTIDDRKSDLVYSHAAKRVEVCLRMEYERFYRKIIGTTISLFDENFGPINTFSKKSRFFPEFEFIVYESDGAFIEPHVDNHSIVTGIVMLSNPSVDFEGGANCFEPKREYKLNQGDCVLFRGEKVEHWITPVKGIRKILQWEFSRI